MKKIIIASALLLGSFMMQAQQLTMPQPSPTAVVKQNFSTGFIELNYSRPSAKGRKIFGDLVPYGKVWRTGANNATTIEFSTDVTIGGTTLKPGKYGLLTIPGKDEWTVIFSKSTDVTSPSDYKMENDVARVTAKAYPMPVDIESFTMNFANITGNSCALEMMWERSYVAVPITTNTEDRVMKQIDQLMNKDNKPYFGAASYYYETGKDLNIANEWVDKAIANNPDAFWMTMLKARILAKKGDKAGAKLAAQKTIEKATIAKNDDYIKMANDLIATL
jgi:hypothetical protein